jgi:tripeptide aminopeptidase
VRSAGLTPRFFVSGGGSDANWYNRFGVPSILLGIGMEGMHTNEEYIRISDLRAAGKLVYRLICQAAEKS